MSINKYGNIQNHAMLCENTNNIDKPTQHKINKYKFEQIYILNVL